MEILSLQAIHSIGHEPSQGGHIRGMVLHAYDVVLQYMQSCRPGHEGVKQGVGAGDGGECKVELATKAQRGSRCIALLFL
jgi:hypothetical protein